jgi:hypothetical protein
MVPSWNIRIFKTEKGEGRLLEAMDRWELVPRTKIPLRFID